jgi:hypothetical protein
VRLEIFGEWGRDARIKSGYGRRRDANPQWLADWDSYFAYAEGREITPVEQLAIRRAHSALLAAMVDDVQITAARADYAGERVNIGAR